MAKPRAFMSSLFTLQITIFIYMGFRFFAVLGGDTREILFLNHISCTCTHFRSLLIKNAFQYVIYDQAGIFTRPVGFA